MTHTLRTHSLTTWFTKNRDNELLALCDWKKVLHIWASDSPLTQERYESWELLFLRIEEIAEDQLGIDIDQDAIAYMHNAWHKNMIYYDMNNLWTLEYSPDVVIFSDTLEHILNPGIALTNIKQVMWDDTTLVITVPNALCIKNIYWALLGRLNEHPEHTLSFNFQTLTQLLEYTGFQVIQSTFCNYQYSTHPVALIRKIESLFFYITIFLRKPFARTLFFVVKKATIDSSQ